MARDLKAEAWLAQQYAKSDAYWEAVSTWPLNARGRAIADAKLEGVRRRRGLAPLAAIRDGLQAQEEQQRRELEDVRRDVLVASLPV